MKHSLSSKNITLSLVKSRQILEKINGKISDIQSNRFNHQLIQYIASSSKKITNSIDNKIQANFQSIISSQTLMSMPNIGVIQKQNSIPSTLSSMEGTKALMYNYWQKNNKIFKQGINKQKMSRTVKIEHKTQIEKKQKDNEKLPPINSSFSEMKLAAYIKSKQKQKELMIGCLQPTVAEENHIQIVFQDYKCQNQSKQYLDFQKKHYKKWKEISSILKALQKFTQHYQLNPFLVSTQNIFELIDSVANGKNITPHVLLSCSPYAQKISEENQTKSGIRFYGKKGKIRAAIKIQSQIRTWMKRTKYLRQLKKWKSAKKIQDHYRSYLLYKKFKQIIFQRQLQKIQKFNKIQQIFKTNYRRNQMISTQKYQIHIASYQMTQWQKLSTQNYVQRQNSQLCRIFKFLTQQKAYQTKIIYLSPVQLPKEIINYYRKLFEIAKGLNLQSRLIIITPQHNNKLPINMCLSQHLYFSQKTINRIKSIIKNKYAYVVPSTLSTNYINICAQLEVGLWGGQPQKLRYFQTISGCKRLQQKLQEEKDQNFAVLPYSVDIYNEFSLLNQLTNLIYRYPQVKRWVLKIDNQVNSRGIAWIDVSKIINNKILNSLKNQKKSTNSIEQINKNQQKTSRSQIYLSLENSLIINKQERIIPVCKNIYSCQQGYLSHFYTRGGVIEASINNFETDLQNSCFTIQIQPDGEWKFMTSYTKITNQNKAVAAYFDSNLIEPPLQINTIVQNLIAEGLFGYYTFQFLSIPTHHQKTTIKKSDRSIHYLNSIECHLNQFSSAHFLKNLIEKQSNAIYIPILSHPLLKQLRLQTFFHLCRLENISFDIQKKVGNVFTFVDSLQCGCVGMMTFSSESKQQCLTYISQVLGFINNKFKQTTCKKVPQSFMMLKNSVNGFLKNRNKNKIKSSKKLINTCTLPE